MEEDQLICICMEVYKSKIVNAIEEEGLKNVDEVGDVTQAGTMCGQCRDDIEEILDEINDRYSL